MSTLFWLCLSGAPLQAIPEATNDFGDDASNGSYARMSEVSSTASAIGVPEAPVITMPLTESSEVPSSQLVDSVIRDKNNKRSLSEPRYATHVRWPWAAQGLNDHAPMAGLSLVHEEGKSARVCG